MERELISVLVRRRTFRGRRRASALAMNPPPTDAERMILVAVRSAAPAGRADPPGQDVSCSGHHRADDARHAGRAAAVETSYLATSLSAFGRTSGNKSAGTCPNGPRKPCRRDRPARRVRCAHVEEASCQGRACDPLAWSPPARITVRRVTTMSSFPDLGRSGPLLPAADGACLAPARLRAAAVLPGHTHLSELSEPPQPRPRPGLRGRLGTGPAPGRGRGGAWVSAELRPGRGLSGPPGWTGPFSRWPPRPTGWRSGWCRSRTVQGLVLIPPRSNWPARWSPRARAGHRTPAWTRRRLALVLSPRTRP